jgi:hypothetical protein
MTFRSFAAVNGARIARRKTGVSRRPMARRLRRSKTIDGGKTSETRRFREVDGALRRAGAGRAHCGDKADCADNRPAPHLSAAPTSSPRVRGEGACGRRLLPLAQRAAPHLSASPTSSPRARGEGACGRRLLPLAQRASPHLSAAPTSSPRKRGEGARRALNLQDALVADVQAQRSPYVPRLSASAATVSGRTRESGASSRRRAP